MSVSPSFNADPLVTQSWQRAIKPDKPYRCLQIQFKGETLCLINTFPSSASCIKDFENIKETVSDNEGCYLLFRLDDSNSWNLISYVPEDAISSTQEKMLYAVSKSSLKAKFGIGYFGEDWHVNSKRYLTFINYKNDTTLKKEAALSASEKIVLNGIKDEEQERARQLSDLSLKGKTALNQVASHLDTETQREIQKFKAGEVSFIRIGVDSSENICLEESKRVFSTDDVKNQLTPEVPAFYLFSLRTATLPSNVFLYYCPEKSPKNRRLVYATRMKSVREHIQALGVNISKSVEMQDPKDFESKITDRPAPSYERERERDAAFREHRASASPKVEKPHPLFGGQGGPMKKKVVIPPPGAW